MPLQRPQTMNADDVLHALLSPAELRQHTEAVSLGKHSKSNLMMFDTKTRLIVLLELCLSHKQQPSVWCLETLSRCAQATRTSKADITTDSARFGCALY